jgi:hypothetical protein
VHSIGYSTGTGGQTRPGIRPVDVMLFETILQVGSILPTSVLLEETSLFK